MAKSKILKEMANNEVDLDVALKRLLLICNDLDYKEIYSWVDKELNGYASKDPIPEYRDLGYGIVKYSGIKGNMMSHLKLENQPFPVIWIPEKYKDLFYNNYERGTIANIVRKAKSTETFGKDLTSIAAFVNVGIGFTSIYQYFDKSSYNKILNKVSNVLFKIFMKLDKEYGNLDTLDIDTSNKAPDKIRNFENQLKVEIGGIRLINIGDNNTIEKSNIGSEVKNED